MKFNIPTPQSPTDSEMKIIADKWWENHKGINFICWPDILVKNSFDISICKTDTDFVNDLISLEDNKYKNIDSVRQRFFDAIEPSLIKMNCKDSFFIKLISRSPKDYLADEFAPIPFSTELVLKLIFLNKLPKEKPIYRICTFVLGHR